MSDGIGSTILYILVSIIVGMVTLGAIAGIIYLFYWLLQLTPAIIVLIIIGCVICFFIGSTIISNNMYM